MFETIITIALIVALFRIHVLSVRLNDTSRVHCEYLVSFDKRLIELESNVPLCDYLNSIDLEGGAE